jgi:hypothetical protein
VRVSDCGRLENVCERRVVSEAAGDFERLLRQHSAPFLMSAIAAERPAEPGEQPGSIGAIVTDGTDRLFKQREEVRVAADAGRGGERPAVGQGGAGQPLPVPEFPGVVGSMQECLIRRLQLACPNVCLGEPEQEVTAHRLVRGRRELECFEAE